MCRFNETYNPRATIFDIQRGSMVDGPGLRTTVFIKGCPLRCAWCHNPEAMRREPETVMDSRGQTKTYGREYSVSEIMAAVRKDLPFYAASGGGLTISGGEPMASFHFTHALAAAARDEGIHVVLDSTGFGTPAQWEAMLPLVDLFLLDYKATDPDRHQDLTGVKRSPLIDNLRFLASRGARIRLRCPIIPSVNDNDAHFSAICGIAREIDQLDGIDLLPYHDTGRFKYAQLGRPAPETFPLPDDDAKSRWMQRMLHFGARASLCVAA